GIAGHAGVFSTAPDLARFGGVLLEGGRPLLKPSTLAEMTTPQAKEGGVRRGIGLMLRSDDPASFTHPFSPRSFGHTGFTGTSLWIDPERELFVVLLTNRVHPTRENTQIREARIAFHTAVVEAVGRAAARR
ncbi:MAG: serine hydrolase, partial [Acidobacteriota bacterium]